MQGPGRPEADFAPPVHQLSLRGSHQRQPGDPGRFFSDVVSEAASLQGLHLTAKIQDRGYGPGSLWLKPRFENEPELYFILRRLGLEL